MHINIEGKRLKITETINNYVKQKIKKVNKHFNQIFYAQVTLEVVKLDHIAEVTISSDGNNFHNKIKSDDLYKSIDLLFDKVERQIRRYKEYENDKIQKAEPLSSHLQELSDINKSTTANKVEVKDKEIPFLPMSDLEAVMQFDQHQDKSFFAYINEQVNKAPSFLIKDKSDNETKKFILLAFNDFWEEKEIEVIKNHKLQVNHIILLKPSLEFIENAVSYLEYHKEERFRLFTSIRTKKTMFLFKNKPSNYTLVREKV